LIPHPDDGIVVMAKLRRAKLATCDVALRIKFAIIGGTLQ